MAIAKNTHLIAIAGSVLAATLALAGSGTTPQVGDTFELVMVRDSAQHGALGSSGSTHDKDIVVERVIGLRAEGLKLEHDLPSAATAQERAQDWQFPARLSLAIDTLG